MPCFWGAGSRPASRREAGFRILLDSSSDALPDSEIQACAGMLRCLASRGTFSLLNRAKWEADDNHASFAVRGIWGKK